MTDSALSHGKGHEMLVVLRNGFLLCQRQRQLPNSQVRLLASVPGLGRFGPADHLEFRRGALVVIHQPQAPFGGFLSVSPTKTTPAISLSQVLSIPIVGKGQ